MTWPRRLALAVCASTCGVDTRMQLASAHASRLGLGLRELWRWIFMDSPLPGRSNQTSDGNRLRDAGSTAVKAAARCDFRIAGADVPASASGRGICDAMNIGA